MTQVLLFYLSGPAKGLWISPEELLICESTLVGLSSFVNIRQLGENKSKEVQLWGMLKAKGSGYNATNTVSPNH
jgi:hypothetical protein